MLSYERRKQIMQYLETHKSATVENMAKTLYISPSTVRRDLNLLQQEGLVRRTRGGVILVEETKIDLPFNLRNSDNYEKKQHIANLAVSLLKDDMTLFLDSSSTVMCIIKKLHAFHNLHVITNNPLSAFYLSEKTEVDTYCVGGKLFSKSSTVQGATACHFISQYNADIAFLSCRGFDETNGPTDFIEEAAQIKRTYAENARKTVLLIDSTKMNKTYFHNSLSLSMIDVIVSDKALPDNLMRICAKHNIQVLY